MPEVWRDIEATSDAKKPDDWGFMLLIKQKPRFEVTVKERIDKCLINEKGVKIVQWPMPTPKVQFQPRYLTTTYIRDAKYQGHRYRKIDLPFHLPGKVPRIRKMVKKKGNKDDKSAEVVVESYSESEAEIDKGKITEAMEISEKSDSDVDTLVIMAADEAL